MSMEAMGRSVCSAISMAAPTAPRGAPLLPVPRSASTRNTASCAANAASLPGPHARSSGRNVTGMRSFSQAAWFCAAALASASSVAAGRRTSVPDENDRDGVLGGVGKREIDAPGSHELARGAMELHGGAWTLASDHFHFAPDRDAPHLERLRERFLGREAHREGFGRA